MNKKFTMMVAALLAAGGFSANAEVFTLNPTAQEIKDGATVYLVAEDGTAGLSAGDIAMGVASVENKLTSQIARTEGTGGNFESGNEIAPTNYFWTVKKVKVSGAERYTLTNNKTGKYLAFDAAGKLVADPAKATAAEANIYFELSGTLANGYTLKQGTKTLGTVETSTGSGVYVWGMTETGSTFKGYKATAYTVPVSELNDVLGGDGFTLTSVDKTIADENNVFSNQIKAINFEATTNSETDEVIEGGVYFVLDGPAAILGKENVTIESFKGEGDSEQDAIEAYIAAFNECTFVAVSSWDNYQTTEVGQGENGLKLLTIKGSDLYKYTQSKKDYQLTQKAIYVGNAVFKVTEPDQYAKKGQYELTMSEAYHWDATAKKQVKSTLNIGVTMISGVNYVTTTSTPSLFKTSTSSLVKGIDLLKKEQAAAVYTFKFVSGEGVENSEYGKYLASANGNQYNKSELTLVAQGDALIDTKLPQYQFAITKVGDNQEVTFTNIETGGDFTMQLFATDVENQYKLVGQNEYVYIADENAKDITNYSKTPMSAMVVELTPVTVDANAGFFKKEIDNNEAYRLAFAKNATTDDKLYVAVDPKDEETTVLSETESLQVVFEPVTKQGKVDVENISTNFVYNKDGVIYRASSDLVKYYTYNVRVVDTENTYLSVGQGLDLVQGRNAATDFIVKYRYDGSVALTTALSANSRALSATGEGEYTTTNVYEVPNKNNVNLYLEEEKLGVSLPAKSGHFTFEAENGGGFMNVNDKNEGIIAIRTEAAEDLTFWVDTTNSEKMIPSFYISKGGKFMYNSTDSLYNDGEGMTAKSKELYGIGTNGTDAKAIFKAGTLVNSDTLKTMVDNKEVIVAAKADQNKGILGGVERFQFNIVKASDAEDNYVIRNGASSYLANYNGVLGFMTDKANALRVVVEGASAPTSNESVATSEVKVIAQNGSIVVKNAAGKNVVVSTILGQVVANEVLTSDNATVNVPAGIVVVSVDGESFKVNVK